MVYYLIRSYGGYANGVEVEKFQARDSNEAYEKMENQDLPFALNTILNERDVNLLFKLLSKLIH